MQEKYVKLMVGITILINMHREAILVLQKTKLGLFRD